ncbi:MAG: NADPH:quinone oxidoreductase family protein [Candidatus Deferrimicrobiaceae bacterium]
MKALLCTAFGPLERLAIREIESPRPGPDQVLIDVKAASLNFPDVLMAQGLYQVKPPLPYSPGAEIAGVVAEAGTEVRGFQAGDRVSAIAGWGGFAEECAVGAGWVTPLPAGMDYETGAAFLFTYETSLHALRDRGRLEAGETLLVLGAAGGVGLAAVEIGKVMGARVLAAASSEEKLALCRKAGADATINYASGSLRERVKELTGGAGVDVVYDPVGGPYTESALRATAWGGRLLVIGFATGDIPKIPINLALLKERSIVGVYWGDSVKHDPEGHLRNVRQLMDWFAAGKVRPSISERVPLEEAAGAMRRLFHRQVMGKVVILPEA